MNRMDKEQCVARTKQGVSRNGETVWSFRIPNSTDDYIELSTYGCSLQGLYVHDGEGTLCGLTRGMGDLEAYEASGRIDASLLGGKGGIPELLARKVWEVAEQGSNYVFLTCQCTPEEAGCGLKVGARVMWVNLNRLVVDFFCTPEEGVALTWSSNLTVQMDQGVAADYQVRAFCPEVALPGQKPVPVAETEYAEQQFAAIDGACFLHPEEDIKPMAELMHENTGMHLSAYGTFHGLQAKSTERQGGIQVIQWSDVTLEAGESFAGRVIYGVDYLHPQPETETEPNPFVAFGFGL